VRVTLACVCGSDLWYYRGLTPHAVGSIGHEFIGIIEDMGADVAGLAKGDLVVAPFLYSDGTCVNCRAGWPSQCVNGGAFGRGTNEGGQGEAVRVPYAGSTLVRVPGSGHSDETMKSLLALSDVMGTGHHAAVSAGVKPGSVVAVVGDGAVGLCAVIASRRLGAARIISMSRNPARQALARRFGATDLVAERGDAAVEEVLALTDGLGVDAALECVGTGESMTTAFGVARPGSTVGAVGAPHDVVVPIDRVIFGNTGPPRWRRAGPDLPAGADRRRARGPGQSGPRLRLRDGPRWHRGGVCRDGRATGHQVGPAHWVGCLTDLRKGPVLSIILVSYFVIVLDISIVITGLPKVQAELGFSPTELSWVQNANTLAFGGLLLLGARAGDLLGRRRTFITGMALFTVASLAVGVAQSAGWLIAARAAQGVGAAILAPSTLALLSTSFADGHERTRAVAWYGAVAGVGASVGLGVGGILADSLSWRFGFFINGPIGLALILAAPRFLPESERQRGALPSRCSLIDPGHDSARLRHGALGNRGLGGSHDARGGRRERVAHRVLRPRPGASGPADYAAAAVRQP
jgi:threonine dehydrogenase-like Zn-dependent dehydrogenase